MMMAETNRHQRTATLQCGCEGIAFIASPLQYAGLEKAPGTLAAHGCRPNRCPAPPMLHLQGRAASLQVTIQATLCAAPRVQSNCAKVAGSDDQHDGVPESLTRRLGSSRQEWGLQIYSTWRCPALSHTTDHQQIHRRLGVTPDAPWVALLPVIYTYILGLVLIATSWPHLATSANYWPFSSWQQAQAHLRTAC